MTQPQLAVHRRGCAWTEFVRVNAVVLLVAIVLEYTFLVWSVVRKLRAQWEV